MVTKGNDFGLNENNYDLAKLCFFVYLQWPQVSVESIVKFCTFVAYNMTIPP